MNKLPALVVLMILITGCATRVVVEIPEARVDHPPRGPRVALTHVKDERDAFDNLGRVELTRYDVRPVSADLFTQALRTALEEEGCLVAEIADPGDMDPDALSRFLEEHAFAVLIQGEVLKLTLREVGWPLGRGEIESVLRIRVLSPGGPPELTEIADHVERQWGGMAGAEKATGRLTADAVMATVEELLSYPVVRQRIGLEVLGPRGHRP
jgi:hypothetical protein